MTTKEQTELLMDAVQKLMKLYKALSEEIPTLTLAWDSELKKIPRTVRTTFSSSRGWQQRKRYF